MSPLRIHRRTLLTGIAALAAGAAVSPRRTAAQPNAWVYPIQYLGNLPGDGFYIRHGYACENTWYNPGWWHTAEDWYALEGDTAGALVIAVADGVVRFAGSDYPGRVVIVEHAGGLFSMYGHLDPDLRVREGDFVTRGDALGTVLQRTDGRAPSHLHFEVRTFLLRDEVNGDNPRFGYGCGYRCPPGPGYWPMDAPEHPSTLGWRNPTHVLARSFQEIDLSQAGLRVRVASLPSADRTSSWRLAGVRPTNEPLGEISLQPGEEFPLLQIRSGPVDSHGSSTDAYRIWYRIALPDGTRGWVRAAIPSNRETGSDGEPSSLLFNFLPVVPTAQ
ncbi:MAG TPA: M23 family metallopeptidase [Thermomicrobiales bacterium]